MAGPGCRLHQGKGPTRSPQDQRQEVEAHQAERFCERDLGEPVDDLFEVEADDHAQGDHRDAGDSQVSAKAGLFDYLLADVAEEPRHAASL